MKSQSMFYYQDQVLLDLFYILGLNWFGAIAKANVLAWENKEQFRWLFYSQSHKIIAAGIGALKQRQSCGSTRRPNTHARMAIRK